MGSLGSIIWDICKEILGEEIAEKIKKLGVPAMIAGAIAGGWSWLIELPGPAIFCLSLAAAAFGVSLVNGIQERLSQRKQKKDPAATLLPTVRKNLREVSYLSIDKIATTSRTSLVTPIGDSAGAVTGPTILQLKILNTLQYGDPKAGETATVSAKIIYYDVHWQRLFDPMNGCWVHERHTEEDLEMHLNDSPVTFRPQTDHLLAIAIRPVGEKEFFALTTESLSFLTWENPALRLPELCFLRIILTGETVEQTFYYYIQTKEDGTRDYGPVPPPEGMR